MGFKKTLIIFIFILAGLGIGLSQVNYKKMAYNNGPWLIKRKILEVFKLYSPQQDELKISLNRYMLWHRKQMLPRYVNFLGSVDDRVRELDLDDKKLTPEEVNDLILEIQKLYYSTSIQLAQMIIPILVEMNEQQVDRTRTLLDRRLNEWRELKSIKKEILMQDLLYSWTGNFEYALGPLNNDQLAVIEKTIFRLFIPPSYQLAYEGNLTKKIMEALEYVNESGKDAGSKSLEEVVQFWRKESDQANWRIELSKMTAKVLNLSDKKQRKVLRENIHQWRELMVDLQN